MAIRKTASKTSKRAEVDIDIDKKTAQKAKKKMKSFGAKTLFVALVLLVVSAIVGAGATYFLTRNDCFELLGKDETTLTLGSCYFEDGVKAIAFNKDVSQNVQIETNLISDGAGGYTATEVGTYYIIYKINNIKYNSIFKVQKIRLITFVEASEDILEGSNG